MFTWMPSEAFVVTRMFLIVPVQPLVITIATLLPEVMVTLTESMLTCDAHFQDSLTRLTDPVATLDVTADAASSDWVGGVGACGSVALLSEAAAAGAVGLWAATGGSSMDLPQAMLAAVRVARQTAPRTRPSGPSRLPRRALICALRSQGMNSVKPRKISAA